MDWLFNAIGDFLTWSFDTLVVPMENSLNYSIIVLGFVGLVIWLRLQAKYNAQAANDPNQIK